MADLDVEVKYYKAIEAAKISGAEEAPEIVPLYQKKVDFKRWVKTLDIYDLDKDAANFHLDEAIVTKFEGYRRDVAAELARCVEFNCDQTTITLRGQTKNIGSCQDGSKIGKMNEVDSLYVLDNENIVVEEHAEKNFKIFWKDDSASFEIKPRQLRNQLASAYANVINKLPLPDCMTHAGYRSPEYSGLRYNGPAATSQFLAEDKDKDHRLLTWDMTATVCLDSNHRTCIAVRETIQPILERNPDKMFGETTIHLFPNANEELWKLSTAQLEADLLREIIPPKAPFKIALSRSTALEGRLKKWNSSNFTPPKCLGYGPEITKKLNSYLENPQTELRERLDHMLQYAHIWIPLEKRKLYHEDEKAHVSINTAAIKHILLTAALEEPEAFSAKENDELVWKLVKLVFTKLGNPSEFSSPHAFLEGVRIPHLSILSAQAANKMVLAQGVKWQCRMLVEGAVTKVRWNILLEYHISYYLRVLSPHISIPHISFSTQFLS